MINIKLLSHTDVSPLELASHAALICYQSEVPELGKTIDVENRLFKVGHHTTLQHFFLTFSIEDIAVGDITFGMHLVNSFYNSDQRSGRYCAKMFVEPDFEKIENYIKTLWPEVDTNIRLEIMNYIKNGVTTYQDNMPMATELAKKFIKEERPFTSDKYLEQNGPKIAQEQMRSFISIVFPTAFDFTINLSTLAAIYESAWSPALRATTEKMVAATIEKFPEIAFMFRKEKRRINEWGPTLKSGETEILYKPKLKILNISGGDKFIIPTDKVMNPVDKLHFLPEMMDNNFGEIKTEIEISAATMGQDQRHRTIRRSQPEFTGNFYLPPIPATLGLEQTAKNITDIWKKISAKIPSSLAAVIAPYGAMVQYKKAGSLNAIAHEQKKRLCWCTQEEIYHLSRLLRKEIEKIQGHSPLLKILEPPCYAEGLCTEGARYCGRDINKRKDSDYFPERKI